MRKVPFLLVTAFILGLSAMAPTAEAGCFTTYWNKIADECSNLDGYIARDMCGLDAGIELAGCVRRTVIGV